ncbi:MAG: hypothetical protein ACR2O1_11915 [Boseongicola sp.]
MTSLALGYPPIWNRLEEMWKLSVPTRNCPDARDKSREDARIRQEFVTEMLDRNPDAFQSEQDVQSMMLSFPGRF